jgi:hypothetical protein
MRDAVVSTDGLYRYELFRRWAEGPRATWIMLNPSTADARADDATVRRVMGFSQAFGCGACIVVNLYAWRATEPAELWKAADPVGPHNSLYLVEAARRARLDDAPLIAAWGAHARAERIAEVLDLPGMDRLTALDVTRAGQPRHPLYLRADLKPRPWTMPAPAGV